MLAERLTSPPLFQISFLCCKFIFFFLFLNFLSLFSFSFFPHKVIMPCEDEMKKSLISPCQAVLIFFFFIKSTLFKSSLRVSWSQLQFFSPFSFQIYLWKTGKACTQLFHSFTEASPTSPISCHLSAPVAPSTFLTLLNFLLSIWFSLCCSNGS